MLRCAHLSEEPNRIRVLVPCLLICMQWLIRCETGTRPSVSLTLYAESSLKRTLCAKRKGLDYLQFSNAGLSLETCI